MIRSTTSFTQEGERSSSKDDSRELYGTPQTKGKTSDIERGEKTKTKQDGEQSDSSIEPDSDGLYEKRSETKGETVHENIGSKSKGKKSNYSRSLLIVIILLLAGFGVFTWKFLEHQEESKKRETDWKEKFEEADKKVKDGMEKIEKLQKELEEDRQPKPNDSFATALTKLCGSENIKRCIDALFQSPDNSLKSDLVFWIIMEGSSQILHEILVDHKVELDLDPSQWDMVLQKVLDSDEKMRRLLMTYYGTNLMKHYYDTNGRIDGEGIFGMIVKEPRLQSSVLDELKHYERDNFQRSGLNWIAYVTNTCAELKRLQDMQWTVMVETYVHMIRRDKDWFLDAAKEIGENEVRDFLAKVELLRIFPHISSE